jgi:FixJ family two-component response regulator
MQQRQEKVFVIDDERGNCEWISAALNSVGYCVKAFSSAEEFLSEERGDEPHCVLVDLILPGMSGVKLCRILSEDPACGFAMISGNADVPSAIEAMKLGAIDFLEKPFGAQRLLDCVHEVMQVSKSRLETRKKEADALTCLAELTPRELEIFNKVADGVPTKTIAAEFAISTRTVDVHRSRILKKLRIESPLQLANFIATLNSERTRSNRAM